MRPATAHTIPVCKQVEPWPGEPRNALHASRYAIYAGADEVCPASPYTAPREDMAGSCMEVRGRKVRRRVVVRHESCWGGSRI